MTGCPLTWCDSFLLPLTVAFDYCVRVMTALLLPYTLQIALM